MKGCQDQPRLVESSPSLLIRINDREHKAIVDTGAEANISSAVICGRDTEDVEDSDVGLRNADGSRIHRTKIVKARLELADGHKVNTKICIVPGVKHILLGMPFLRDVQATLDLKTGYAKLCDRWYNLYLDKSYEIRRTAIDESDIIEGILEKSDQLNEECKKTLARILEDFKDLWKVKYLTKTSICKHEICLDTDRPICCRPRPYTPDQARTIKEEVKKMLDEGIIRPSKSPFASCVVLVKKKTGEWRFCIDYRPLNKATIKDSHPLPRIKDLLMSIEGARYFVSLDLRSGYWQVEVADEDIHKTAFRTQTDYMNSPGCHSG